MKKQKQRIQKRRLLVKASEEGMMKAVEYIVIGVIIGISLRLLFLAVAGVMTGSILSKVIKLKFIERRFN
ncbi:hypothetical protein HN935_03930 [archaeon]|jgi:flagellar biosynthesis protein FliR|nr:hypothetical protein [archaeon]